MTETTSKGETATPDFVWKVAQQYNLNFPQVVDASKALYKYANSGTISLPFQVAVDLRSMKIVATRSGKTTATDIELLAVQTLGN